MLYILCTNTYKVIYDVALVVSPFEDFPPSEKFCLGGDGSLDGAFLTHIIADHCFNMKSFHACCILSWKEGLAGRVIQDGSEKVDDAAIDDGDAVDFYRRIGNLVLIIDALVFVVVVRANAGLHE
jgi:hypothetical protein